MAHVDLIFCSYTCSNCKTSLKNSDFSKEEKQVLQSVGAWLWMIQIKVSSPPPLKNRFEWKAYWSPTKKASQQILHNLCKLEDTNVPTYGFTGHSLFIPNAKQDNFT